MRDKKKWNAVDVDAHFPKRQKSSKLYAETKTRSKRNFVHGKLMDGQIQFISHISYVFLSYSLPYRESRNKKWRGTCVSHWKLLTVHFKTFICSLLDNPLYALVFNNASYCFHFEANWIKSKSLCACWCVCVCASWIESRFFVFIFFSPSHRLAALMFVKLSVAFSLSPFFLLISLSFPAPYEM